MAKRSSRSLDYQLIAPEASLPKEEVEKPVVELGIDPPTKVTYNNVTNLIPSRVIREVNGTRYEWQPGQTLQVKSEDTDALRNLILGERPCCGNRPNLIFQVSED